MKIWKFPLEVTNEQIIEMPLDAKILTVQMQDDVPCLWAAVIPTNVIVDRTIKMHGTGHTLLTIGGYIGTIQVHGGLLVWHIFDGGEQS